MQSMVRRTPWIGPFQSELTYSVFVPSGLVRAHGDDGLQRVVGRDVFEVVEVVAVDAAEVRDGIDAAEVQDQHGAGHGVLLVVAEGGFDEQLFADEARRRMAGFAGFARRTQPVEVARGSAWARCGR